MILPDGFQYLLKTTAEVRLRGKFEIEFVNELYEYFKDHDLDLLMRAFQAVGALGVPVGKIRFEDFMREVVKARNPSKTQSDSIQKAIERRQQREKEKQKTRESWTSTTKEIIKEQAKNGNQFAKRRLEQMEREEGKP